MENIIKKHKDHWFQKDFLNSVFLGFILLSTSLIANRLASDYAALNTGAPVGDLFLDLIKQPINVEPLMVYGPIVIISFIFVLLLKEPKRIPFVLKSTALFILIRSFFVILTHLSPLPGQVPIRDGFFLNILGLNNTSDMFFSGHTGFPFLYALVFWNDRILRYIFIFTSVFFAVTVLLGHMHYSIDVFSAFFITYTIFIISERFFVKDRKVFLD